MKSLSTLILLAMFAVPSAPPEDDPLALLPHGNGAAIIEFQKITASELWSALSTQSRLKDRLAAIERWMTTINIKMSDLRRVTLLIPSSGMKNLAAVLNGNFDREALLAWLQANPKISSEKYRDREIYLVAGTRADQLAVSFHGSDAIIVGAASGVRLVIDAATGARPNLSGDEKLVSAINQSPQSPLRFALPFNPEMARALQSSRVPLPDFSSVNMIFGYADVASGANFALVLRNNNAEDARAMANQLSSILRMAIGFLGADPKTAPVAQSLKTVTINGDGADVRISGSLSNEALLSIIGRVSN
jgi:hypothetical protein